jgi:tetraacyldisaccharide 4'-kinase
MKWNPLSAIYGGAVGVRNALYDRRWLRSQWLQGSVVSVGNISAGGSGKTPFVILLGELLQARGICFDVLSRGYGRQTRGVLLVEPDGLPRDFGDEPLLIARRLQACVVVGEDRYEAGRFAESRFGTQIHLLDDGFQHRGLGRDFDIVLATPKDARDRLLPAGRLREPVQSLARADAVVLIGGASADSFPVAEKMIWRVRRGIVTQGVAEKVGARPLVFCGIARPRNFLLQLRAAGMDPVAEAFFRDHYLYTEKDVRDLLQLRQRSQATGFITTEKDAVNLGPYLDALAPLAVVRVTMELADAANVVDTLVRVIEERRRCS